VPTLGTKALSQESVECSFDAAAKQHVCGSSGGASNAKDNRAKNPPAPSFLPPPRSIADITAILDSEKPDLAALARMKSAADAKPADDLSEDSLAQFYYARSETRGILGRSIDALTDSQQALAVARQGGNDRLTMRIGMAPRVCSSRWVTTNAPSRWLSG
jgi:hypothetical protein